MSTVGSCLLVAAGCTKQQGKDSLLSILKSRISSCSAEGAPPVKFDVPDGEQSLKFGSFDNLIRLTDDLAKYDGQVEAVLRRLERQFLEIDPNGQFQVLSQRVRMPFEKYIRNWQWDDAKYPKSRGISENATLLLTVVNKLDEEARNKASQYNDLKTQRGNVDKKDTGTLTTRDLVDILTPDVVRDEDFIYSEHLTTVVVVVPKGGEQDFLNQYERLEEKIVPMSARQLRGPGTEDKDGNTLWRIVMFKKAGSKDLVDSFRKACKDKRFVVREFDYSTEGYSKLNVQRQQLEEDCMKAHTMLRGLCQASWSDVMIAWLHVKAMRVFVESVLRFGVPPHFASFLVQLNPSASATTQVRKELADILRPTNSSSSGKMQEAAEADGEEYFPYVSFSFTPFSARA